MRSSAAAALSLPLRPVSKKAGRSKLSQYGSPHNAAPALRHAGKSQYMYEHGLLLLMNRRFSLAEIAGGI
jgi:hypothetical protein